MAEHPLLYTRALGLFALAFASLSACAQGGHAGDGALGSASDAKSVSSAPASASSPPSSMASATVSAAPPTASLSAAPPSATASPGTELGPVLVEVRSPAVGTKMFVDGEGKVRYEQSMGAAPRRVGFGRVPAARVEAIHELLRKEAFCGLAPKVRESSPGYILVEARFTDVACLVELPEAKWDKDPKAKRVMDALRKLEAEACPTGCKP